MSTPENSKPRFNPVFKQPTPDLSQPKPSTTPSPELQQLDGQSLSGTGNPIVELPENLKITKSADHLSESESIEFILHPDGLMMKAIPRPGYEPQFILIDGSTPSKIFGFARNKEVASLICNGVNWVHHANVLNMAADKQAKQDAADAAKGAIKDSKIILPPNAQN